MKEKGNAKGNSPHIFTPNKLHRVLLSGPKIYDLCGGVKFRFLFLNISLSETKKNNTNPSIGFYRETLKDSSDTTKVYFYGP